jgi:S-formylglutathione hydrolase FrmB
MKKNFLFIFSLFIILNTKAATVDTVVIYSNAMHKNIKCVVIKPAINQRRNLGLPVVYLLHGYSGKYSDWIIKVPELKKYADEYKLMIVCPDGDYSSWYFDSPVDSTMRYETYIGKEVPDYIDAHYPTIKNRKVRAITGLSMGGHGGLFLGFRHANEFGACGSMSGGVDLQSSRNRFDVIKRIGDTIQYADNWNKYSIINVIENYPKGLSAGADSLAIIFDCGTEDFFYDINHALHEKMVKLKIPHDYIERPGNHDWNYWANAVKYQLLFFREYFQKTMK